MTLHVDHVVPQALGGTDEPTNLVTACADCNLGKTSIPADAPIVADVEQDALRWARAIELVADGRVAERLERQEQRKAFEAMWFEWRTPAAWNDKGGGTLVPLDNGWETTIDMFLASGLDMGDLEELIRVAMESPARDTWRYFCGCCWKRIEKARERAKAMIAKWEVDGG